MGFLLRGRRRPKRKAETSKRKVETKREEGDNVTKPTGQTKRKVETAVYVSTF